MEYEHLNNHISTQILGFQNIENNCNQYPSQQSLLSSSTSTSSFESPHPYPKVEDKKDKKSKAIKKKKLRTLPKSIDDGLSYDSSFDLKMNQYHQNDTQLVSKSQQSNLTKKIFQFNIIGKPFMQLERPIENYRYFFCAGDMMIEIYNDRDIEDTQERRMKNFANFKNLICTEKVGDNMRLVLNSRENVLNDLSPVITLLENKQDNNLYYFAQLLKKYNTYLKVTQIYIQSIIDAYRPNNLNDLNLIKELRNAFHVDYMANQIAKKMNDEFYCMVQVGPNFNTKAHGYNMLQFSKAMVAILGTDEEQMGAINMRHGFRDFIYSDNKNDMYIKYLEGIINGADNCKESDQISFETKLFTYDHIIIPCKCLITRFIVPLPKQLEYKSTTGQYYNLDMINYMQFQIDAQQIKRVLDQRTNFDHQEIIKDQMDSLEYSVRSQIFIEKFYPEQSQNS